jgi:hypothetical protein
MEKRAQRMTTEVSRLEEHLRRALEGKALHGPPVLELPAGDGRPPTAAEAWPACPAATEENRLQTVQELRGLNGRLRQAVRGFPDGRLAGPPTGQVRMAPGRLEA